MSRLFADISVSLDGYVAGPDANDDQPLGAGGEQLHDWAFAQHAWRSQHGMEGGEDGAESALVQETVDRSGATIMGRRMFSGGSGPWEQDGNSRGWWGDDPPFHHPVFVLTHHPREPLEMQGGTTFTFVTDGPEAALELAREAAGERDVQIGGGAEAVQQYLRAGLLDELQLHIAPVLLGSGVRLLDGLAPGTLEQTRLVDSPLGVTHVSYRVHRKR
jgi:dihydrofolate reductase